jgi:hypothetical protein
MVGKLRGVLWLLGVNQNRLCNLHAGLPVQSPPQRHGLVLVGDVTVASCCAVVGETFNACSPETVDVVGIKLDLSNAGG